MLSQTTLMNVLKAMGSSEECTAQLSKLGAQFLELVLNKTPGSSWISISSSGLDMVWHQAFHDKWSIIVLLGLFLYMFGSNILYAKLVSSMAAHAAFSRIPLSVSHYVEYKRHMPVDMFCWHGAVVMATQRGHWVCVYSLCVFVWVWRTGAQLLLESTLNHIWFNR